MGKARGCRGRLGGAALALLVGAGLAGGAAAAPRRAFDVAAQPLARALLDFAVQANISIGLDEAARCRRPSHGVDGTFTLTEALDHLLAGTGCGYEMVDASTVRVFRLAASTSPPPARPSVHAAPQVREPPAPGRAALPELVVTATRRSALALRLPDAISVIPGASMAEERDSSIADLAGHVAGLTVTNLGPGADKAIMRGLSDGGLTGHAQSTVGLYLDDTRMTYNAPDPDLRLTDIDRVELLRGPQGALYGAGSVGGVVHIVTRQPNLDRYGGMVSIEGSATDGGAPSGVVEGVANLPIAPGRLAIRAVAYAEHDGGYVNDVRIRHRNANSTDRVGGRLAVKLALNADWSLDLGAVHQTLDSADSQYALQRRGGYRRYVHMQEPHGDTFDEVHLTLEGQIPAGEFKNTLSVVRHEIDTRYDASPLVRQMALVPFAPAAFDEADHITTVVDEATLASVGASRLQWLVGGFVSYAGEGLEDSVTTPTPAAEGLPLYLEHRTDQVQEFALYGEANYDLTPKLAAGFGARLGLIDVSSRSIVVDPLNAVSAPFRGRISDLEFAPKVSLRYQFDDRTLAYVLVSEGARGGGFNTAGPIGPRFIRPSAATQPFDQFKGDELWNFEAGVKARLLSDRLDLRAAAFYEIWNNIQSDQLLPSGFTYTANIGDGRNLGLEIEAAYAVGDVELRLESLLDEPELVSHPNSFVSLLHSGLPGAPRGSIGASIRYQRRDGDYRPFLDASINYVGQSRLNFTDTLSRRMGDYTVTRLTGGVDTGPWRLAAFVYNPLGITGDTFAFGNPFTLLRTRQITPLRPPTGGLQLTRFF